MLKRQIRKIALATLLVVIATPTFARQHHKENGAGTYDRKGFVASAKIAAVARYSLRHRHKHHRMANPPRHRYMRVVSRGNENIVGGRPRGCPHAYCGCSASLYVFGRIIPELNLAEHWLRFPKTAPAPGMAAARHGHVFIIIAVNGDGSVVAYDGNSGHGLTRIHTVSLRGFVVVNPRGRNFASVQPLIRYANN